MHEVVQSYYMLVFCDLRTRFGWALIQFYIESSLLPFTVPLWEAILAYLLHYAARNNILLGKLRMQLFMPLRMLDLFVSGPNQIE